MGRAKPSQAKGLIEKHVSLQHFDLTLVTPSAELASLIANYWIIEWDLPEGKAYAQENLPHASQHLVLDPQFQSGVFGLTSGAFTYHLQGRGRIFGVKFRPGHFRRIASHKMNKLTDNCVPISSYFEADDDKLLQEFAACRNCAAFAPNIEKIIKSSVFPVDPKAELACQVVGLLNRTAKFSRFLWSRAILICRHEPCSACLPSMWASALNG